MGYRNIFIANTSKLSTKNEQLIVNNGDEFSFPIEDIRCVLLDDVKSVVSASVISKFADAGVTMIVCDSKHMPTAALSPINGYSRRLRQINLQFEQSVPSKKKLWQQIVIQKIENQAKCLELMGTDGSDKLLSFAKRVQSGDPSNIEGSAAAFYFKALFGKEFCRDAEIPINAALNYGYAIVRAIISRTLCLYGFEPSLGIHHKSELNSFNLADDIIEPFRPFVDLVVASSFKNMVEFGTVEKATLLQSVNASVIIEKEKTSVANAIERTVQSYTDALKNGNKTLVLPAIMPLEYKSYE